MALAAVSSSETPLPLATNHNDYNQRRFLLVNGSNPAGMSVISEIFNRILTPLYGSQEKAIEQIHKSQDRRCFLLYEGKEAVGVLNFKTMLSDEFEKEGVKKSVEIKSLFVDHSAQNSGKGLGSFLLEKLHEEIRSLNPKAEGIHVTVSETKKESLNFFLRKGFQIAHEWKEYYQPNVTEYLLSCPTKTRKQAFEATSTPLGGSIPELSNIISNAHFGRVHVLIKLSDGTFISGSEDGSLNKWSSTGELVCVVYEPEPTLQPERNWITAASVINNNYWVSGERNGRVSLWKTSGEFVKEIKLKVPKGDHVSHAFNSRRITCFAKGLDLDSPSFFAGFPTMFDEYNLTEGRTDHTVSAHSNDWVYCLQPLTPNKLLTVIGATINLWDKNETGWHQDKPVVAEGQRYKDLDGKMQRPFISCLTSLSEGSPHYGLGQFDGSVKVLDITRKEIVHAWKEHKGKVWTVQPISEHILASGGEDRNVRLWDTRQSRMAQEIPDHPGEITSMLALNNATLVVGSCPDRLDQGPRQAELRLYDFRK